MGTGVGVGVGAGAGVGVGAGAGVGVGAGAGGDVGAGPPQATSNGIRTSMATIICHTSLFIASPPSHYSNQSYPVKGGD